MSIATLLHFPEDDRGSRAFSFEHAMAHRAHYAVMGPLHQFSILPYFIEPIVDRTPLRNWALNHQRAHDDFAHIVPAFYAQMPVGIPADHILIESNLDNPDDRKWWTFINHTEHHMANEAMLPLPNIGPRLSTEPPISYPWWIPAPRWTLPPYW